MTDMTLPFAQDSQSKKETPQTQMWKFFFALNPPEQSLSKTAFFKSKFYWSFTLSLLFWIINLAQSYFFSPDTQATWIIVVWVMVASLQILTVGLPFLLFTAKNWRQHLSKLPAIISAFFSFAIVINTIILNHNQMYLPFVEITSFILLVLAYLFFMDQKNASDAHQEALALNKLLVPRARVWLSENESKQIATQDLKVGDKIWVYAGEAIARDGIIVSGMTSVDESPITLEKLPLHKAKGDEVYAGTINRDSDILIEIQHSVQDDILSLVIQKAQSTYNENSPLKQRALFISHFYPLFFMITSAVMGFIFFVIKNKTATESYMAMLSVLLAAPLCLDSLSNITIVRLVGNIFKKGIVVSRAATVEMLGAIHTLFFNKTGVLTDGKFLHSQDVIQSGNNYGEVLSVVFSLENGVQHPLADAMSTHPWFNEIDKWDVRNRSVYPGLGVSGEVRLPTDHVLVAHVGNLRFMKRQHCQISKELKNKVDELEALGETVILCGYEKQVRGILTFADTLRHNVRRTIRQIHNLGIKTALITGDTEKTVTQVLGTLHLNQIYSRCTPEEKVSQIEKVQKPWNTVALVTEDTTSESFANAKLTISTDCGLSIKDHPADVIVMGSNIEKISWLLQQTRIYRRALRAGLWGSAFIGVVAIVLTYLDLIKPQHIMTVSTLWALLLLENISKLKVKE